MDTDVEARRGEAPDEGLREAVWTLARLARLIEQVCQESGLSLPQYRLLVIVSQRSQRAGELAGRAAVSRPTLTALVDGLERQGLLRRTRVAGDRRGILLELTGAGTDALARAEKNLCLRLEELIHESGAAGLIEDLHALATVLDHR